MSLITETVLTFGSDSLQNELTAVTAALRPDGVIGRWVNLTTGEHKAFLTRDKPEGAEVTRTTPRWLATHLTEAARNIADGTTYEVADARTGRPRFYVNLTPPENVDPGPQRYAYRARRGTVSRLLWREFADATAVQAQPLCAT